VLSRLSTLIELSLAQVDFQGCASGSGSKMTGSSLSFFPNRLVRDDFQSTSVSILTVAVNCSESERRRRISVLRKAGMPDSRVSFSSNVHRAAFFPPKGRASYRTMPVSVVWSSFSCDIVVSQANPADTDAMPPPPCAWALAERFTLTCLFVGRIVKCPLGAISSMSGPLSSLPASSPKCMSITAFLKRRECLLGRNYTCFQISDRLN
jgi:hypothetical protein